MITAKIEASEGIGAKAAAIVFVILLSIATIAIGALVSGYVMHVLWGWFIVPLFGVPGIAIAQALGLSLVARAFVGFRHTPQTEKPFSTLLAEAAFKPFAVGAAVLGFGWVIKGFI